MIRQRLAVIACEALPLEGVILRDQLYVSGLDVILTRDPWMHRVDIARATGREMELTPEHDGRMIADVVAEWARRHGKPFHLVLTGPLVASTSPANASTPTCDVSSRTTSQLADYPSNAFH